MQVQEGVEAVQAVASVVDHSIPVVAPVLVFCITDRNFVVAASVASAHSLAARISEPWHSASDVDHPLLEGKTVGQCLCFGVCQPGAIGVGVQFGVVDVAGVVAEAGVPVEFAEPEHDVVWFNAKVPACRIEVGSLSVEPVVEQLH